MEKFWGYKHMNGSIHVKCYFDIKDIIEAQESSFVDIIVYPFLSENRITAFEHVNKELEIEERFNGK